MKFKTIFILFNIVILFSFGFIFITPLLLLGAAYSGSFWAKNWPLGLFFLAILGALNAFFAANWRLFTLVEKEDWKSLNAWLSARMFTDKKVRPQYVKLFVNTALLRSDLEAVERLEEFLSGERPLTLRRHAVLFATARLLKEKGLPDAERFISAYIPQGGLKAARGVDDGDWLVFDYALVLILQKRAPSAGPFLRGLLSSRDAMLTLLSAYFLGTRCAADEKDGSLADAWRAESQAKRASLAAKWKGGRWSGEAERAKGEVHIVILSKLMDEAGTWLFAPATGA